MTDAAADLWVLVFRPEEREVPTPSRVRRLLKIADSLGLTCVRVRDARDDESDVLRAVIRGLAERVHQQAELLAKNAEKESA